MTLDLHRSEEVLGLVDADKGLVDRRIFSDEEIYQQELEHIFARAWNFMAHESMLPNPGDFFLNYIGEDRVIVVRDKSGDFNVLLNTCRHRGNAVCRAEEGHATSFMCTYHGWTYDLKGALVGVPGFKDYYHEDLDRDAWGLVRAPRVESYKGFIFATLDPDAPTLDEYLGDVGRMCINLLAARGDLQTTGGIQKWTIQCNWKFAADNVWDYYHGPITHASAGMAGWLPRSNPQPGRLPPAPAAHMAVLGEYGHAIGGPSITEGTLSTRPSFDSAWRGKPETSRLLGQVGMKAAGNINVFPNLWIQHNFWQISLRLPKGPRQTEIWWFAFTDKAMDEETRSTVISRSSRHNGPAGMFEMEDGENWDQSTRGTAGFVSRRFPLNYSMNVGRGEVIDDETGPARIEGTFNEHAQLWYYRSWSEWMAAESWPALRASHSYPTGTL